MNGQWYGVSIGDGYDGVSHLHPDYFVRTDDPWRLARCAVLGEFVPRGRVWAREQVDIAGDAECVSAVIDAPPVDEQKGTGDQWADDAPAWLRVDVHPCEPVDGVPQYGNLLAAFDDTLLAMVPEAAPA